MVTPREEIENCIQDMAYITATPRTLESSYYKLKDGTIIKTLIHVNHVTGDPQSPQNFAMNSTNLIVAYVPKEKRVPAKFQPYGPSELSSHIIDDDMEQESLRENFSVYDLSNGMVLSIKTVAGQIKKTSLYTQDGEPVYVVNTTPIVKIKKN